MRPWTARSVSTGAHSGRSLGSQRSAKAATGAQARWRAGVRVGPAEVARAPAAGTRRSSGLTNRTGRDKLGARLRGDRVMIGYLPQETAEARIRASGEPGEPSG
jgi:hypothetical protein